MFWSALVALASGLVWFCFAGANMSGSLTEMFAPDAVWSVIEETGFGTVWAIRMIVALVIVVVTLLSISLGANRGLDVLLSLLAGSFLASLAGVGHTQVEDGMVGVVHVTADTMHLLAAGAWLGGLAPLGFILLGFAGVNRGSQVQVDKVLMRFSGMGYVAVATLVGTGLVNSWFLVGTVSSLLGSVYGKILLAKLVFFGGMLMLAAANQFWLVPALEASAKTGDTDVWRKKLRTHVLSEQGLGLLVLLCLSIIGTIQPAIGQ